MRFCCLTLLLLSKAVCLAADETESEFIPAWEVPADALLPLNVHVRQIPSTPSDPPQLDAWLPRSEKSAESASKSTTTADDIFSKYLDPIRTIGEGEKSTSAEDDAKTAAAQKEMLKALKLQIWTAQQAWAGWQSDDSEFESQVATVVDGQSFTNGDLLWAYYSFLQDMQKPSSNKTYTPAGYVEFRNRLLQRELNNFLLHHEFAESMRAELAPDELRALTADFEVQYEADLLPLLLKRLSIPSIQDFAAHLKAHHGDLDHFKAILQDMYFAKAFQSIHRYQYQPERPAKLGKSEICWVEGTVQWDAGSPVNGAIVSRFREQDDKFERYQTSTDGDEGAFNLTTSRCSPLFAIDFRTASEWPHQSARSDTDTAEIKPPVIDALLVQRSTDETFVKHRIVVPQSKWGELSVTWKGPTNRLLVTLFVIPWRNESPNAEEYADATRPESGPLLDYELKYVRSFPVNFHPNERITIPNLAPGMCVVVLRTCTGSTPLIQTTMLNSKAELTFAPLDIGIVKVRCEGTQVLRIGSTRSNRATESIDDLAASLPPLEEPMHRGRPDVRHTDVRVEKSDLQFELRMLSSDQDDNGFLLWASSNRWTDIEWNPKTDRLFPGHYSLTIREGAREKQFQFEVIAGETTILDFARSDLVHGKVSDLANRP